MTLLISGLDGMDMETKADYIQVMKFSNFAASPLSGLAPLKVYFVDQSVGIITDWLWDFGDGKTGTSQNPFHIYYDPASYTVSLTTSGPNGTDTATKTDYITISAYGPPCIKALDPESSEPAKIMVIRGYNFGDLQGDSVVHIGGKTFGTGSSRIKLWSNRKIRIKIPDYTCNGLRA